MHGGGGPCLLLTLPLLAVRIPWPPCCIGLSARPASLSQSPPAHPHMVNLQHHHFFSMCIFSSTVSSMQQLFVVNEIFSEARHLCNNISFLNDIIFHNQIFCAAHRDGTKPITSAQGLAKPITSNGAHFSQCLSFKFAGRCIVHLNKKKGWPKTIFQT